MSATRLLDFDAYFREHSERHLEELFELLRIPSISTLPEHAKDVRRAGEWAVKKLKACGFPQAEILETNGHPCVFGEWIVDESLPTLMFYGHLDVQPVDPEDLWDSPPFDPVVRDGKIYARGASDDKGCLLTAINAIEAHAALAGTPPVNIKVLLEGEEEVLSPNLPDFLRRERHRLKCDVVVGADGKRFQPLKPGLTVSVRGYCALQIDVTTANRDLHGGQFAGPVPNPNYALASIIAGLNTADGRVAAKGFYDDVVPPSPEERAQLASLPFDEEHYLSEFGLTRAVGEHGYTILERQSIRPSLDVVGVYGGYQGEGMKNVLPATAHAKLTIRLVPDQDPNLILDVMENHIRNNVPPGVTVGISRSSGSSLPYRVPPGHPILRTAISVLREAYGEEPVQRRSGAAVPLAGLVSSTLGCEYIFMGFGDPDDRGHAPNEFFRVDNWDKGLRIFSRLLESLPDDFSAEEPTSS